MTDIDYINKYYDGDKDKALKRLKEGEPVQYIVGNVNFYGYEFKVDKNVLIPRFETEELVEKTVNLIDLYFDDVVDILDIGTGSGCIAITLNKLVDSNVCACDISSYALDIAKENNRLNNTDVKFIKSDIFSNIEKKYDIIISNPPYISRDEEIMDIVKNNEPEIALYAPNSGLYFYEEILKNASKYLKDKFLISFEIGYKQKDEVIKIASKYFSDSKIWGEKDLEGNDRFIFILKK